MKKIKKNKGILFWITGLTGCGKTEISKLIKEFISSKFGKTLIINGYDIRDIFDIKKYNRKDRLKLGKKYTLLAKHITDHYDEVVKYFEKKYKAKIDLNTNNDLNLEDYIIEFKSKTKKVLDKIEKVERLESIKTENKKEDDVIKNKGRKIFKKRKFRKKFYKKKTK